MSVEYRRMKLDEPTYRGEVRTHAVRPRSDGRYTVTITRTIPDGRVIVHSPGPFRRKAVAEAFAFSLQSMWRGAMALEATTPGRRRTVRIAVKVTAIALLVALLVARLR